MSHFVCCSPYKTLHQAPSARATLVTSLSIFPSMEDGFRCVKVTPMEGCENQNLNFNLI